MEINTFEMSTSGASLLGASVTVSADFALFCPSRSLSAILKKYCAFRKSEKLKA